MGSNRKVAAAAVAMAMVLCTWFVAGWGGESTTKVVTNVAFVVFAIFAASCAGVAVHTLTGRARAAWGCIGVGLLGWVLGSVLWCYVDLVEHARVFPSLADVGYLLFPVGATIGLAVYPAGHAGQSRARLVLDGLIVTAALFQISWVAVLRGIYETHDPNRLVFVSSLAYPVADLVVITMAVLILTRARAGQRRNLTVLTIGLGLMALSDSAFVYMAVRDAYGGLFAQSVNVGYVAGLLVIGVAALLAAAEPASEPSTVRIPPRSVVCLPYVPIAIAAVVCAPIYLRLRQPGTAALFFSTTILVVAVLLRQYFLVRENHRLLILVGRQAMRDPLTGLANRALFNDRLTHAMQLHMREHRPVSVLSIDLDDFKLVNDNLGHPAGDELLVLVADRLLGCVRTGDTVARVGGDEFTVLLEGETEQSGLVAHRVLAAFDERFVVDGHDLSVRPSIGLAMATAEDTQASADALLKQADVAMYSAKRSRTGEVRTFDPGMEETGRNDPARVGSGGTDTSTVRLLGELRRTIDDAGLSLVYQPKFGLHDGELVGVEALVRWPHPERGLIGPDKFLPLVREHGLMRSMTDLVIEQALDDVVRWEADGFRVPMAVNLFAPLLCDLKLPHRIQRSLDARGVSPDLLTIEITEDLLLDDVDSTRQVLDSLRARGVRVSIDDFGSGYSALGYLCELPIDEVKLDRQFIVPTLVDRRAATVVRAVVDLAHELGMTIVAEGVEDDATMSTLRDYGCDVAQGFHFSPPLTATELRDFLGDLRSRAPASSRSS